jgi:hypothetical protein
MAVTYDLGVSPTLLAVEKTARPALSRRAKTNDGHGQLGL